MRAETGWDMDPSAPRERRATSPRDQRLRVVRYRFATTWRAQRGSLVGLALVIGLIGGVALGSIAAARRTASSYTTFLAGTNPSSMIIEPAGGAGLMRPGEVGRLVAAVKRYPEVTHVEAYQALPASLVVKGGVVARSLESQVVLVASYDGLLFNQDRVTITRGRRPNPARADEVVVTQAAAAFLHLHVGQRLPVEISSQPPLRVNLHVVGIGLLNREVVQDQIARYPTYIVGTPALAREATGGSALIYLGVQLRGGARSVTAVEHRWTTTERFFTDFQVASQSIAEAEQSIRPVALALGVFGGIAGLAALLLAFQAVARQMSSRRRDLDVMRALGADTLTLSLDGVIGLAAAVLSGAVLAALVAFALSPLAPLGPVRSVYPHPGLNADWTVLGLGAAVLIAIVSAATVALALTSTPVRLARRHAWRPRSSATTRLATRAGLPLSAVTGVRYAVDSGRGRAAVPTRWTMVGAVVALCVVNATLTFGSSLHTLVSRPALYGWNWNTAVVSSDGYGPVPNAALSALRTPAVAAYSNLWFVTLQLNGVEVPTLLEHPGAVVAPPIIAGHAMRAKNQIVLGAATLAQLHLRLGDVVDVQFVPGYPPVPIRLTVVGVATMPAIGISEGLHTSMGVGALIPSNASRVTEQLGPLTYGRGCNGPNMVLIRLRSGASPAAGRAATHALVTSANAILATKTTNQNCEGNVASALSVQRPAQIVNYRSMGTTPLLLASGLALGAVVALGLTLVSSVNRRRRDLALLKALGFTQRQLAAAVAWQASLVALVGVVVGVPSGVALGRWLWDLFAREIGAVPSPTVPV
ncbi:MAG: FtsX-like permease family protein, partial [Acidimicrobiales bacterium]